MSTTRPYRTTRRRRLAACVAVAFALTAFAPACSANYDNVLNCNDTGTGSLRDTIATAASGDTIVLNPVTMQCSLVTLGSEIAIPQADLTVKYNANTTGRFTVSGNNNGRIFDHTGSGVLKLQRLEMKYGHLIVDDYHQDQFGGCINSSGTLDLEYSVVRNCTISGSTQLGGRSGGGGIAAVGLILNHSSIKNCSLGAIGYGGGADVANISARYCTISGNSVNATLDVGSALYLDTLNADSEIDHCTISGNTGDTAIALKDANGKNISISDSTISGNTTSSSVATGIQVELGAMAIYNSTIAFNGGSFYYHVDPFGGSHSSHSTAVIGNFVVISSIIANNTSYKSNPLGGGIHVESDFSGTMFGSNNIVLAADAGASVPADTSHLDPLLLPLSNNGGPTLTHAFRDGSPAFGAGNNPDSFATDQRGSGYPRMTGSVVDIGAFQQQVRDVIFASGFD